MSIREDMLLMLLDDESGGAKLDEITITSNGTYRAADHGLDGWYLVNVNVVYKAKLLNDPQSDEPEPVAEPEDPTPTSKRFYYTQVTAHLSNKGTTGWYITGARYFRSGSDSEYTKMSEYTFWPLTGSFSYNAVMEISETEYSAPDENGRITAKKYVKYTGHNSYGTETRVWEGYVWWYWCWTNTYASPNYWVRENTEQ